MKTFHAVLLSAIASMSIVACSAKVTSGGDAAPANTVQTDAVQGPNIDGDWVSGCSLATIIKDGGFVDGSKTVSMTVSGRSVTRKTQTFNDKNCTVLLKDAVKKGSFRYLEKRGQDTYLVEYSFDLGNGMTELPEESIRLVGEELYVSDFNVSPDLKMVRKGATQPAGVIDCAKRGTEMTSLSGRAQDRYEKAISDAFRGIPAKPATDLRREAQEFEAKYKDAHCDGQQTTKSFVDQIYRTCDEIDRLQ